MAEETRGGDGQAESELPEKTAAKTRDGGGQFLACT